MGPRIAELADDGHLLFPLHVAALDLLEELAGPPPARVLDAGCGTGEYVAALARRGYDAYGVEVDARLLAAGTARHPEPPGRLVHGDLPEVFDLVRGPLSLAWSIGGALCELADEAQVADVLAQLADLTRPGGRVLVALPNFGHLEREAQRALETASVAPAELHHVVLENPLHGHDSPQMARIEGDETLLQLPPISAFRDDGRELRLERAWRWPPEAGRLCLEWWLSGPEGDRRGELSALPLTRARLEPLLPGPARWRGDFAGREWSPDASLTIAVFDSP